MNGVAVIESGGRVFEVDRTTLTVRDVTPRTARRAAASNRAARLRAAAAQYGYPGGCIVPGCERNPILHHITPRRRGGPDAIENLLPICKRHENPIHLAGSFAKQQAADDVTPKMVRSLRRLPNFSEGWLQTP